MRTAAMALVSFASLAASAQLNISFLGQLNYQTLRNSNLSNIWGYTDEFGNEYALVGVCGTNAQNPGGLSVVSLADPANPQEVFFYPGPASIWREVKVWGDHAYVTTEAENGGLAIVDLSPLPQSTDLPAVTWLAPDWDNSHSLFIDENGRLYIHGANRGNGGVIMYDLTQGPMNPVEVGAFDSWYCHDSFARGDTLYAAHIYEGFFSIVDVSNPAAPVLLGIKSTPSDFTHNTWLDASGQYLFTTDERTNAYVAAYDVSDPGDITEVDRLRSDNGSGAIPHNTYWLNGYAVTSYYTFGVAIYDVSHPHNMVEVGHYDTTPLSGDGFNGAWGVYPFFPSGNLIISDIELGLFVLAPTYVQACRLEGHVRNALTSAPVGNATVQVVGTTASEVTGVDGAYATGYYAAGSYTVTASAPGYFPATISGVQLVNGQVTLLDIELTPMVPFTVTGTVSTAGTGQPVDGALVRLAGSAMTYETTADAAGQYAIEGVFADTYALTAGRWGWRTACPEEQALNPGNSVWDIQLQAGYADDFALDLGWTSSGTATAGLWERGAPEGTSIGGAPANPSSDASGDCGDAAYVTGLAGGGVGDHDVDNGTAILTSPVFDALAGEGDAYVRYARWFVNAGGSGSPNDQLTIALHNGVSTATLETVTAGSAGNGTWVAREYRVSDFLTPTSAMRLIATTADASPGHIVEAGLDVFELFHSNASGVLPAGRAPWRMYPNPAAGFTRLEADAGARIELRDASGRKVLEARMPAGGTMDLPLDVAPGTYTVVLIGETGASARSLAVLAR